MKDWAIGWTWVTVILEWERAGSRAAVGVWARARGQTWFTSSRVLLYSSHSGVGSASALQCWQKSGNCFVQFFLVDVYVGGISNSSFDFTNDNPLEDTRVVARRKVKVRK